MDIRIYVEKTDANKKVIKSLKVAEFRELGAEEEMYLESLYSATDKFGKMADWNQLRIDRVEKA